MDTVVVDTNTITFDDWNLRHAPWRLLLHRAAAGTTRLVVPEVVIREVVGVYGRALKSLLREAGTNLGHLRALGVAAELPLVDLKQSTADYEKTLRYNLRSARVLEPTAEILELTERAIARRPPFNEQGGGFRDAVIWRHVLDEVCGPDLGPVSLISDDRAFGKASLKPLLAKEAQEITLLPRPVALRKTVAEYVRAVGVAEPQLLVSIMDLIASDPARTSEDFLAVARGMRYRSMDRPGEITLQEIHEPVISVVDVTGDAGSSISLVEMEVTADVDLYVELWDEQDGYLTGSKTLSFDATAAYDAGRKVLDGWSVEEPSFDLDEFVYWCLRERGW